MIRTMTVASTASELLEWGLIAAIFFLVVLWIASVAPNKSDREWLPRIILWGFAAKLVGTFARYFMTADLYGAGDAFAYHGRGITYAGIWRTLSVPVSSAGGEGTAFTELTTGLLYAIYTPAMRSGYLMFAFIAFLGQLLFYLAFRPWLKSKAKRRYAIAVFFFPSIVFWPASVGKDALMMFFIGLAVYGISRILRRVDLAGLVFATLGLYLSAQIRPHITAMLALAAVLGFMFVRRTEGESGAIRRVVPIAGALIALVFAWGAFATDFEVSLEGGADTADPAAFLDRVADQTAQGGSAVDDGVIDSPLDVPSGVLKVLFRPLIFEASSAAIMVSAVEGTALLLLVVWKLPTVWRNRRMLRANPMLLLSFFYTGGFIIAFSSFLNLGILARQRVQVLPFFLALLVVMGWPDEPDAEPSRVTRGDRAVRPYQESR